MSRIEQKIDSLYERQEVLTNVAGFIAPSSRELSESLSVINSKDSIGVNQHLGEIYQRQKYNKVDKPENAIKQVTKEYISYYQNSKSLVRNLGFLATQLSEIYNPNIYLIEEVNSLQQGHRAFIRYVDLRNAYSDSNNKVEQRIVLRRNYFDRDKENVDYIFQRMSEIKVRESRKLICDSIEDQSNRSIFWHEVLCGARYNFIAGPIIKLALRNIN